jgi:hypothetical protein
MAGPARRIPDGSGRQAIIAGRRVGEALRLIREPRNRHIQHAIAFIRQHGRPLGHLPGRHGDRGNH